MLSALIITLLKLFHSCLFFGLFADIFNVLCCTFKISYLYRLIIYPRDANYNIFSKIGYNSGYNVDVFGVHKQIQIVSVMYAVQRLRNYAVWVFQLIVEIFFVSGKVVFRLLNVGK